eukprot:jgi/Ulvmu1/10747/UM068_0037.1
MQASTTIWHVRPPVDGNPIVFFDITIGGTPVGRLKMELWADICPKTCENFRQFCTGEHRKNGVPQGYKDCKIHRIERDFIVQGGDFVRGDGTGVMSIYDGHFPDENFIAQHTGPGLLSMANSGKDQNGCQFFLTCSETPHLNGKHVVFGRVIEDGLRIVRKIEHVQTDREKKPRLAVAIAQCGEIDPGSHAQNWPDAKCRILQCVLH